MNLLTKIQIDWYFFTKNTLQLVAFLQSPSYKVRRLAAAKLGQLKDVDALPFLIEILDDAALKVVETTLYAIEVIAKANNHPVDLQKQKQVLKERKRAARKLHMSENFKFEKGSWTRMHKTGDANQIPKWLQF